MNIGGKRVLVTGAGGGIGRAIAETLAARGARLLLTGRKREALADVQQQLASAGCIAEIAPADLTNASARARLVEVARTWDGGIDALVNNAGDADFALLHEQSERRIEELVALNVVAPMLLTRALLPHLESRAAACVVNVGSTLGHIGHPGFAAYGATKAALATFSQALARECAAGPVRVLYVAPRSTRTSLNSPAVVRMNEQLGSTSDPPERVAMAVAHAIEKSRARTWIGWPEKLFVRINALVPGLVDRSLRARLDVVRELAQSGAQKAREEAPVAHQESTACST